ncbi:DUF3370 domain-containing protein [Microcoleus sp. bin38.metabat.b11b12b14.051]|uniref:DUF3370 domain-containing protein n=1 Tax=Microcoleus sp. bin38.metabat.b11b12b14.051 TaxID=2742709 RepID=UPI0025FCB85D|nr:DUF3370 domain-containing protein [Microcoleus sp. bin38.metabat.b11b12b14.051]
MIQKQNLFSRIAGISTIVLCAVGGFFLLKQPAQSIPTKPTPEEIVQVTEVRSLPGQLDNIPLFNSDSPEWVKKEGILLSTFPPEGKKVPAAHLNFPLQGQFNLFAHHFSHTPPNLPTLYIGAMLYNPGTEPITVEVLQAESYLMEPDPPFKQKPEQSESPNGEVYSGPGIRAVDNVLRGMRQSDFPEKLVIPGGESAMLMNRPIPVRGLEKPINGRSTFMRLNFRGGAPVPAHPVSAPAKVYAATLAMYAKQNPDGSDRPPTLQEWQELLDNGGLAGPRDKTPTPPGGAGNLIYGRVAGVQQGSGWQAQLVDRDSTDLKIPEMGKGISFAIATLRGGKLGTEQVQAAKLLARYPDTACEARGNYGVYYDLALQRYNAGDKLQTVGLSLAKPLKEDVLSKNGWRFRKPSLDFPYFRGTVRLRYQDGGGVNTTRYVHLWHRVGQVVEPMVKLKLAAGESRSIKVDFIYPPDATPPQVLTVRTLE